MVATLFPGSLSFPSFRARERDPGNEVAAVVGILTVISSKVVLGKWSLSVRNCFIILIKASNKETKSEKRPKLNILTSPRQQTRKKLLPSFIKLGGKGKAVVLLT